MVHYYQMESKGFTVKKGKIRIIPLLLAVCMLFSSVVLPAEASNPGGVDYVNTHVNTGNQRQDIIAVAMTQLGYREKNENDTKYGDWYGLPNQPWCAMFVSWCARQADISTDIIKRCAWAHPNTFGIPYYHGSSYTPKPGDLFFTEGFTHVGLVLYVEGDFFYCIEGNGKYHDYTVPDDPDEDSYYVMINKRLIRSYYFGVPPYEGCDKDHDYVKGHDSGHPHKEYYECRTCGDKYYTGYTACVTSCSRCFSCGCTPVTSTYYLVANAAAGVKLRTTHDLYGDYMGYATVGEAVHVLGLNSSAGWAYVEYDGQRGHIPLWYLTSYHDIPDPPTVTCDKDDYTKDDDAVISWTAPDHTEQYRVKVYKDGALYHEENMGLDRTLTLEDLAAGTYEVQVIALNRSGASDPGVLEFTVRETYTLTYDARGGSGAPAAQTQKLGEVLTVSGTVPQRTGYTFLGWTDEAQGNFVRYVAGDTLSAYDDLTLYAVWKSDTAALQTMTIEQMPARTMFLKGETLDTAGLRLRLTYSDGSGYIVAEGYTAEGFDSETYGAKTITITYDTLTVTYAVQIVPYIPGDIDLNKTVDRDDVMRLLWHISFPDRFPIEVPADFNSDGLTNRDDVMRLLWHISFPDRFPLDIEWPEEEPTEPEEPAPTEPEPTEPEEPEPTEPEPTEPEETVPEETEPEETEPSEPEETEPEETEPEETELTEPEPTVPEEGE